MQLMVFFQLVQIPIYDNFKNFEDLTTEAERDNPKMFCGSVKVFRIDIF